MCKFFLDFHSAIAHIACAFLEIIDIVEMNREVGISEGVERSGETPLLKGEGCPC
jgi:hypothetical protein